MISRKHSTINNTLYYQQYSAINNTLPSTICSTINNTLHYQEYNLLSTLHSAISYILYCKEYTLHTTAKCSGGPVRQWVVKLTMGEPYILLDSPGSEVSQHNGLSPDVTRSCVPYRSTAYS
ncbi:hypothetical protein BsWGS_17881 [Bradybaena similaris]